jgi:hypothetical protein
MTPRELEKLDLKDLISIAEGYNEYRVAEWKQQYESKELDYVDFVTKLIDLIVG